MGKPVIAILGGKGMLGADLALTCRERQFDAKIFDLPDFDITNEGQLKNAIGRADVIINCVAYTNVDKAQSEAEIAYKINAEAVGTLGRLAGEMKKWILHISTDFVFDGELDRPYNESDGANPINVYGKTKLAGEQLLSDSGCQHCIIRLQWTYGRAGNNFVKKLISQAGMDRNIMVVDDQIGCPTATTEIAEVICKLILKKPQGLFHFASAGFTSRFEMAQFIFNHLGTDVNLSRCKTSDFQSPADRPLNSRFDCAKIQSLLDKPIKPWQIPLKSFLEQL